MRWNDDGTVDLKLGPDYDNAVITATQEELGTLFGPDEKPFEGVDDHRADPRTRGPKGGISGPIYAFRPVWEELSGGKLNIALSCRSAEHYTKMMLDLRNGTGAVRRASSSARSCTATSSPASYMAADRRLMASGEYPQWTYDVDAAGAEDPASLGRRRLRRAQRRRRPGPLLPPRRARPIPSTRRRSRPSTATTCRCRPRPGSSCSTSRRYFNGKNWDDSDAEPDSGTVLHLKVGEQGHYHFQSLSALVRDHAGRQGRPVPQRLLVRPDRHEAADQQPGPRQGARVPAGAAQDRPRGAGRLEPRRGLGLLPARQGGVRVLLGRRRRAVPGRRRARRSRATAPRRCCPARPNTGTTRTRSSGQDRQAAAGRQHHRRLLARRGLELLGPTRRPPTRSCR